jgi:hypothetical protein
MLTAPTIKSTAESTRSAVPTNSEAAIFPFVTVRPAQLSSASRNIITYQPSYPSLFIAALTSPTSADATASVDAVSLDAVSAEVPAGADEAAAQLAATLTQLDGLLQFGRWLRENQHSLDNESVSLALEQSAPPSATSQQLGQLWEGLTRAVIEGRTKANHEPLLAVLRAQYFLDHLPETDRSTPALRELATAEVVLPAGVLPPSRAIAAAPTRPDTSAASAALQKQASQQQQLVAYEQALAELRQLRDVRLEQMRTMPLPSAPANLTSYEFTAEDQALTQN